MTVAAFRLSCERCHRNGEVRKLTDWVADLLGLKLQINKAACHFSGPICRNFRSFAALGIPVCCRSYTVNSKRPVPHVAIFRRKYLDFSTFVFKPCHGIQRWHRQNAYGKYIKCLPKPMLRCARRAASLVSSEVVSNHQKAVATERVSPSLRHAGLQQGRQRFWPTEVSFEIGRCLNPEYTSINERLITLNIGPAIYAGRVKGTYFKDQTPEP